MIGVNEIRDHLLDAYLFLDNKILSKHQLYSFKEYFTWNSELNKIDGCCILGALNYKYRLINCDKNQNDLIKLTTAALCHYIGLKNTSELIAWNDDPKRTRQEVLNALLSTAIHIEELI